MSIETNRERETVIRESEREVSRWSRYVDTLLLAFDGNADAPPALGSKLEELRHKRDSVVTKVEALKRHRRSGWVPARRELQKARRELTLAWRSVIGSLDKESMFV